MVPYRMPSYSFSPLSAKNNSLSLKKASAVSRLSLPDWCFTPRR